jgi:hypothetical protein
MNQRALPLLRAIGSPWVTLAFGALGCSAPIAISQPEPPPAASAAPLGPSDQAAVAAAAAELDALVAAGLKQAGEETNGPTSDETFVRRIYLDALGRIPTLAEARAFLASPSPDRRARLIDSLLSGNGYAMQMFNWLADTLRIKDRIGKRGANSYLFQDWLESQLLANRPWDQLVHALVTADGALADSGAAGFLLRDAQMPLDGVSNLLTTFLGADVSCAQCHDHPNGSWSQKDFYGMAAFFGASDGYHEEWRAQIRKMLRRNQLAVTSKKEAQKALFPLLYNIVDLPRNTLTYPDDYQYDNARAGAPVAPALIAWRPEDRGAGSYRIDTSEPGRLRDELARWLTDRDNPRFAAAIANRLWKKAFGMAVQEPVTNLDDPSEASNPALLAALAERMKEVGFDLRAFQRILYNTAAYQRQASPAPGAGEGAYRFRGPVVRRMTAEQAWDSILTLAEGPRIDGIFLRRGHEMRKYSLDGNALSPQVVRDILARMEADGGYERGRAARRQRDETHYSGGTPDRHGRLVLARASELPQPAPEAHLLRAFGQSDRMVANDGSTDGSVPQVMALMNGPAQDLVTHPRSHVLTEVAAARGAEARLHALWLAFLCRAPASAERANALAGLRAGLRVSDLAWVLLNHREFLFVH